MSTPHRRLRLARGPRRTQYLDSRGADRAVMMVLALSAEVCALRERLDTHERLAEAGVVATPAAIEVYEAPPDVQARRGAERRALIERVTRALLEEDTRSAPGEPPPSGEPATSGEEPAMAGARRPGDVPPAA